MSDPLFLRLAREFPAGNVALVVLDAARLLGFMEFLEMPRKFEA